MQFWLKKCGLFKYNGVESSYAKHCNTECCMKQPLLLSLLWLSAIGAEGQAGGGNAKRVWSPGAGARPWGLRGDRPGPRRSQGPPGTMIQAPSHPQCRFHSVCPPRVRLGFDPRLRQSFFSSSEGLNDLKKKWFKLVEFCFEWLYNCFQDTRSTTYATYWQLESPQPAYLAPTCPACIARNQNTLIFGALQKCSDFLRYIRFVWI